MRSTSMWHIRNHPELSIMLLSASNVEIQLGKRSLAVLWGLFHLNYLLHCCLAECQ